jgi:hypothetical protein
MTGILGRAKLWSEWKDHVQKLESSNFKPLPGDPVTIDEFHLVVLAVAYAIANSCQHCQFLFLFSGSH